MKSENKPSRQQLFHNVLIAFFTIKDDKNFSIMIRILLIKDDINSRVNSAVIKMWFCHQSKIKRKYIQLLHPGLVQGWTRHQDICTDIMAWYCAQILKSFKFSWKKVHVIFFLISAYLKQVSPLAPEQARKYLSNHANKYGTIRIFIRIIKII